MEKFIIQKEIALTQMEINEIIKHYQGMPEYFNICMGKFSGNRNKIIEEISKMTEVGKKILLIHYKFREQ